MQLEGIRTQSQQVLTTTASYLLQQAQDQPHTVCIADCSSPLEFTVLAPSAVGLVKVLATLLAALASLLSKFLRCAALGLRGVSLVNEYLPILALALSP